jgi:hypothetical protein
LAPRAHHVCTKDQGKQPDVGVTYGGKEAGFQREVLALFRSAMALDRFYWWIAAIAESNPAIPARKGNAQATTQPAM